VQGRPVGYADADRKKLLYQLKVGPEGGCLRRPPSGGIWVLAAWRERPLPLRGTTMDDNARRQAVEAYRSLYPKYDAFADALRVLIRQLCTAEDISVDLEARAKTVESLSRKLGDKQEYSSLEDVPDLCGIRVITRYLTDIDAVRDLLQGEFQVVEVVSHGGESPEAFGYASLHLVLRLGAQRANLREWRDLKDLKAEVQIRTILQHAWAVISHRLDYRSSAEVPIDVRRSLFRVAALLETGDEIFESFRENVESLRSTYREDSASGEWQSLDLNLDSINAAWSQLPLEGLIDFAKSVGFLKREGENYDDLSLRRMIQYASAAGYKTLGDIANLLTNPRRHESYLRSLAASLPNAEYLFNVSDILTLFILKENPDLLAPGKAGSSIRSEIKEAIQVGSSDSKDGSPSAQPESPRKSSTRKSG
jgi:putative GTP pyrophosphokinase